MGSVANQSALFEPLRIGRSNLTSRVVLAPLTRFRADGEHTPHSFVKEYYQQRAVVPGTLLITEATFISPKTAGFPNAPGIWSDAEVAAWKEVTDAVHRAGSFIYMQLWAIGRTADPDYLAKQHGADLVAPSPLPMTEGGKVPRELSEAEIKEWVQAYATAAKNAVERAGFDGVEIHGANGYLIDQFLQTNSNQRTDKYGGSIENRSRFAVEVTQAVVDAVGADRTGFRLSPWSDFQGMKMPDPIPQFSDAVRRLAALRLAYLHIIEPRVSGNTDKEVADHELNDELIALAADARVPVVLAGGFTPENARHAVDKEYAGKDVAVAFGRHFIANPDLVYRLKNEIPLTKYNRDLFYNAQEQKGYLDYEYSQEFQKELAKSS